MSLPNISQVEDSVQHSLSIKSGEYFTSMFTLNVTFDADPYVRLLIINACINSFIASIVSHTPFFC